MTVSIIQDLYSGSVDGTPVAFDPSNSSVKLSPVMADETAFDTNNKLTLVLLASFDGGKTFLPQSSATWSGSSATDPLNPGHPAFPGVISNFSVNKPSHVNARIVVGPGGNSFSVGANLTIS